MSEELGLALAQLATDEKYSSHERLDALTTLAAAIIYNAADDHGQALHALLAQFQAEVAKEVERLPHDKTFHDPL